MESPATSTKPPGSSLRTLVIDRLRSIGSAYATAEAELNKSRLQRDRAILEASEMGFSRREVADAAGVTVGRVQQIVKGDRRDDSRPGGCPHCAGRIIPQGGNWRCVACGWST